MIARFCGSATATHYLVCAAKAKLKVLTVCSIVLVVAMGPATLTAHAADDSIVVGAISSLTGPATFPEASAAAKAVFDRENGRGGINGKKVDYIVEDDRVDPAAATQAARRLVDDRNVVALVGSASLLECSVNAAYYAQKGVASVQGIGIDPVCFHASNIAPVNVGTFTSTTLGLYYASSVLKRSNICVFLNGLSGFNAAYDAALKRWKRISNMSPLVFDRNVNVTADVTPLVLRASRAGCKTVIFNGIEQQVVAMMNAVQTQKIQDITWIVQSSSFTDRVASSLGSKGEGLYASAEFEPYGSNSKALADFRNMMTDAHVPLNAFAEAGYVAASAFVSVLKTIKGPITREAVTAALKTMHPYASPLLGKPYVFGPGDAHSPNQSSKFVRLQGGHWNVVTPRFVTLPAAV